MKFFVFFSISFFLICTSCTNTEKEKQLHERELALKSREQILDSKMEEFAALEALKDSLETVKDSVQIDKLPAAITGIYNGKMICTESDCPEHVIGDQRNDLWEITAAGVKITNKTGSEKFYTGNYREGELKLEVENNPAGSTSSRITLLISDPNNSRLKGFREFRKDNCVAKFTVELDKIKN